MPEKIIQPLNILVPTEAQRALQNSCTLHGSTTVQAAFQVAVPCADAQLPWPPLRITPITSFHSLCIRKSYDSNCKVCVERMLGHFHQEKGEKEQKYMTVSVHPYLHFNA